MRTLKSYVCGRWHEASDGFATLHDPSTEEPIARASSAGIDFGAALAHARDVGGPALRCMTLGERAGLLKAMSKALYERRDELLDLSMTSTGTTRKDAKFDVDGATGTLAYYAALGTSMGDARYLPDGDGEALGRSARFWGQHVLVPRRGAAVLVNAFNFPAWGLGEKAAAAILAGMPIVVKPATSTAWLAERCVEILVESGAVPDGVLSSVCGSTGDLLARLGPQDVLSFTGSAATALKLRSGENLLRDSTRVNVEADSLNAAVLGTDVEPGSETWDLFVQDVTREITQKTGQKCTAVRRVFVPRARLDDVRDALAERLADVVAGNPADGSATMGPLATAAQLEDAIRGTAELAGAGRIVLGTGRPVDGVGSPAGKGYFFGPTLIEAEAATSAEVVHRLEVFGPVATLLPFDGDTASTGAAVGLAEGCLVTSLYSDDEGAVAGFLADGAAYTGRLYLGSEKMAAQAPGSGVALPQSLHGGPGRAGGGEELGGWRALGLYSQRVALQGSRPTLERLAGAPRKGDAGT
jgi:oxepin-CoA hydrolase/3-oxo-5,6-dehydrosuberyl-CoA semialdehyde dehydrogenase